MGFVFLPSNRVERVLLTSVIERTSSINRTHWKIPARLCAITEPIEQQSGLAGRKQRVLINDHKSDDFHLCGVKNKAAVWVLFYLYYTYLDYITWLLTISLLPTDMLMTHNFICRLDLMTGLHKTTP